MIVEFLTLQNDYCLWLQLSQSEYLVYSTKHNQHVSIFLLQIGFHE